MPNFIISSLPGLLVGLVVGFGVARMSQGEDTEANAASEVKMAKLCMVEAKKAFSAVERLGRERSPLARPDRDTKPDAGADPAERAARTIQTALKRARAEKRWTVAHGKMAERLFPRLTEEAAAEISKEILGAVESGELSAEANAWLPEKK